MKEWPGDYKWCQLREEEWHSLMTWDLKLGDFREKERAVNSPAWPGVLEWVVRRKHPPLLESDQGWERQRGLVSSEERWFSLEQEEVSFTVDVEGKGDFADDRNWVPRDPSTQFLLQRKKQTNKQKTFFFNFTDLKNYSTVSQNVFKVTYKES